MKEGFLKILYVGDLRCGGTCLQRMKTLEELGHDVVSLHTHPDEVLRTTRTFAYRAWHRFFGPADLAKVNKAILQKLKRQTFDILWIDKGLTIKPSTLKSTKRLQKSCIIVGYSPDDMTGNKANQSRRFLRSLQYFDIYFTTKTYCPAELEALGCPRAEFIGNAYDKHTHRPVAVTAEDRRRFGAAVGFIGHWEPERAKSLCFLADAGVDVRVWGYRWHQCKKRPEKLCLENRPLWADDYARAICSFDINLCFLRKANRDLQTQRSIEIPACGGFMLAERTNEHLELFEEGKEAEFFGSDEELLDKVKYYLSYDEERKRIARAGRERCLKSGYSNHDRLSDAIEKVVNLRKFQRRDEDCV